MNGIESNILFYENNKYSIFVMQFLYINQNIRDKSFLMKISDEYNNKIFSIGLCNIPRLSLDSNIIYLPKNDNSYRHNNNYILSIYLKNIFSEEKINNRIIYDKVINSINYYNSLLDNTGLFYRYFNIKNNWNPHNIINSAQIFFNKFNKGEPIVASGIITESSFRSISPSSISTPTLIDYRYIL